MSTLKATTLSNLAGSKTVPTDTVVDGSAKAWVNFNGTGTVAIRRAFNVSSITDNGVGDYTVNFTVALADGNYSAICGGVLARTTATGDLTNSKIHSATQCQVFCYDIGVGYNDSAAMQFAAFS